MGARRYSTEQIIVKLREAEIETWSEPLVRTNEHESRLLAGSLLDVNTPESESKKSRSDPSH